MVLNFFTEESRYSCSIKEIFKGYFMEGMSVGFIRLCNLGLRLVIDLIKSGINKFIYETNNNEKENVKDKNVNWLTSSA